MVLQAVQEHAAECEARWTAADADAKAAVAELHTAQQEVTDLRAAAATAAARAEETLRDLQAQHEFDMDAAKAAADKVCIWLHSEQCPDV